MKVPISWLKDYVDIDMSIEELAERLGVGTFHFAIRQSIYLGLGLLLGVMVLRVRMAIWERGSLACILFAILLLLAVLVRAADETLSIVRSDDPLLLARACYHLGNRHVPLQIGNGLVRYPHDHVLDDMLIGLGLQPSFTQAPFEPEPGAYGGSVQSHGHVHAGQRHDDHAH